MRNTFGVLVFSGLCSSPAPAQDNLSLDFSGRIGTGYLTLETASDTPVGFSYDGYVLKADATGTVDFAFSDNARIGAVIRATLQRGQNANFDRFDPVRFYPEGGKEFDSEEIELAVYTSLGPVTLSFGDMQTAFSYSTRKLEHGGSILDGGNAVWMAIGDGLGSLGSVDSGSTGPGVPGEFTTLRADFALSGLTFSISDSRQGSIETYVGAETFARSEGLSWQSDLGTGKVFVGIGRDRGPIYEFKSTSVGWQVEGLNLVLSKVKRSRAPGSFRLPDYELTFTGLSASYEFGDYVIGFAKSNQGNKTRYRTFAGEGQAFWIGWSPKENMSVDFEVSESELSVGSSQDTKKASLALSYEF